MVYTIPAGNIQISLLIISLCDTLPTIPGNSLIARFTNETDYITIDKAGRTEKFISVDHIIRL
jgi:hypothetical protein